MNTVKYYGIDIGDGESAVATVDAEGALLPKMLMLGSGKSILSVVGLLKGEPIIGDQAILQSGVTDVSARFKSRYLHDPKAASIIKNFAQGLREKLQNEFIGAVDPYISLGCPAGWTALDRQRYAEIVSEAGFPNLHTVAESRAAFLYAHYDTDIGLSAEELAQPALVIDIGSSTTDFAYIVDGKESEVGVFGNVHLGGGLLDRLILEEAVNHSPQRQRVQAVFDKYPSWRNLCELKARAAKEKYFSSEKTWVEQPYVSKVPIYDDEGVITLTFTLDAERMGQLLATPIRELEGATFVEKLQQSLTMAVDHTAAYPPQQLILTGGASRMGFFQDACRTAFPNAKVTECKEPEFTIARGLSIAARIDHKLSFFRRDIEAFFKSGVLHSDINQHLPALQMELLPILLDRIMNTCVQPALQARPGSMEKLNNLICRNVQEEFQKEGQSAKSDKVIAGWIGSKLTKTQTELDTICARNDVERADMALSKIGVNVELNKLHLLPSFLEVFSDLFLQRLPEWMLTTMLRGRVKEALSSALIDSGGVFAKGLASGIETELSSQIQRNVEKVEIRIV